MSEPQNDRMQSWCCRFALLIFACCMAIYVSTPRQRSGRHIHSFGAYMAKISAPVMFVVLFENS